MSQLVVPIIAALVLCAALTPPHQMAHASEPLPSWRDYHARYELKLAAQSLTRGQHSRAEVLLKSSLSKAPDLTQARALLGQILAQQQRWEEADSCTSELRDRVDNDLESVLLLARIALERGRTGEAAEGFQRAAGKVPEDPRGELGLALTAGRALRDWSRCREHLEAALERAPELNLASLPLEPGWTALRNDPEFLAVLSAVLQTASGENEATSKSAPAH
ncbi:MAG: hypothetical protein CMP23_04975 [Rickettsiales bacterium]|nr:hypothetical protein [Rickettsiales bacterium]|tara:strand:- start:3415 stop:4077 length:663 start_codon:yes stop_codon:yes gene_type:complete